MLFAGFNVATGHYTRSAVTVAGVLGNLVGSWVAYGVAVLRAGRAAREAMAASCTSRRAASRAPIAGSRATARPPSSPRASCRSSGRSSRYPAGVARMPPAFWRFATLARSAGSRPGCCSAPPSVTRPNSTGQGLEARAAVPRLRGPRGRGGRCDLADRATIDAVRAIKSPPSMRRAEFSPPLHQALALGVLHGPGRVAADLILGPHLARPLARRLALRRPRPGAAQVLRGRAARRYRRGAAHHPARRGAGGGRGAVARGGRC